MGLDIGEFEKEKRCASIYWSYIKFVIGYMPVWGIYCLFELY